MEKRFIIIDCIELGDQWECDADRKIRPELYNKEEVYELCSSRVWNWDGDHYNTEKEARKAYAKYVKDMRKIGEEADSFEECFSLIPAAYFECYEIVGDKIIAREDLSTYER